jgi:hypothetical protein
VYEKQEKYALLSHGKTVLVRENHTDPMHEIAHARVKEKWERSLAVSDSSAAILLTA